MKRMMVAVLVSGLWINLSEFLRNEYVLKDRWVDHYASMGMVFPSEPANGMVWMIWGFLFAGCIAAMRQRLAFGGTVFLAWVMGFVLMWLVVGNLGVLPVRVLSVAVPWSLIEVALAVLITQRIMGGNIDNRTPRFIR
ncbi:MAG TPA: hypothetical protein PKE26_13065 [Kiritimatiellia bacterium]|nr:hypothetical protein [Kiritimatiellia bacterium]HMP00033.1 hypothetical protein [Kiritimatiellia bacterium]HMP97522.1 hypothetical protein [Kiritimatiellia bacterium]